MMTVILPWPPAGLSPNARVHRMAKARLTRAQRFNAWACVLALPPENRTLKGPVRATVTLNPPRRGHNKDNAIALAKSSQDGVAHAIRVPDEQWTVDYVMGDPVPGGSITYEIEPL